MTASRFPVFSLVFLILGILGSWYFSYFYDYPYYHIWDMDHTVSLDTMVIQSGQIPSHLNHPSYGAYLIHVWTQRIAHAVGALSVLTYPELESTLNPVAAMAEHVTFLRAHSPVIALGVVFLLWGTFVTLFRLPWTIALLALGALGTQEFLLIQSTFIRSEIYTIFWWAFALFALAQAVNAQNPKLRAAWILTMGVGLGLTFLTKIQAVLFVAAAPLLVFAFCQIRGKNLKWLGESLSNENRAIRVGLVLSTLNFLIYGGWLAVAFPLHIPGDLATFHQDYKGNLLGKATLLFSGLLCAYFFLLWRNLLRTRKGLHLALLLTGLLSGFLLAFLTHFTLYSSPRMGLKYLLYDFKMLFLRRAGGFEGMNLSGIWGGIRTHFENTPSVLIFNLVCFVLLMSRLLRRQSRGPARFEILTSTLLFGIAWLNVGRCTRTGSVQDLTWLEGFLNTTALLFLFQWIAKIRRDGILARRIAVGTAVLLLCAITVSNWVRASKTSNRMDGLLYVYGWQDSYWLQSVYGGWQHLYPEALKKAYRSEPRIMTPALAHARNHWKTRRDFEFVLPASHVTHRRIGVLSPGFPVWPEDYEWRIHEVPPEWEGLTFYSLPADTSPNDVLEILIRADVDLFLFSPASTVTLTERCSNRGPLDKKITLKRNDENLVLNGIKIWGGCRSIGEPHLIALKYKE